MRALRFEVTGGSLTLKKTMTATETAMITELMNSEMTIHVRCKSWYISLQESATSELSEEREPQWINFKIYIFTITAEILRRSLANFYRQ